MNDAALSGTADQGNQTL